MNKGLLLFILAPTGLAIAGAVSIDSASADHSDAIAPSAVEATADVGVAAQLTPFGFGADALLDNEATPMSDCDPKEVKRYCAYRSKCGANKETRGAWICRMAGSKKFVARIPKSKSELIPQCRRIRAKIRKMCEPRR